MAITFTAYTSPKPGNQVASRNPNQLRTIYGSLNLGTHASGGVVITAAIINAAFASPQEQITGIVRVDPLGRSVDGTCGARWVNADSKFRAFLEDGTSGVHADAGTADLSAAGKSFDVCILCY
jgi:hypothetical protein